MTSDDRLQFSLVLTHSATNHDPCKVKLLFTNLENLETNHMTSGDNLQFSLVLTHLATNHMTNAKLNYCSLT